MSTTELFHDPARAWAPYEPSANAPWDRARVAHLHRRAGFTPSWPVLERDLADGPEASLERLLQGEPKSLDGQPAARFAAHADEMARRLGASNNLRTLQAVWLHRMLLTPHPLLERMTLFWHDHFATSQAKVNNTNLMRRQNALLRQHALGDFKALLTAIARDPAMLVWLDSATNRKAHPNENYAREVMELFALGRGHYSEQDVQEAARAFTGFFVQADEFRIVAAQHDDGPKTILGETGRFGGDDVAAILLRQPACAEFLCTKLFQHFVSEVDEPSPGLIAPLAETLRQSDYDIQAPLRMILRSQLFFDPAVRRRRVKSPVEFAVGTLRALEVVRPTVSTEALAESVSQMGQGLFAPPSVAGWDWGPAWLNTATSLARTQFILAVLSPEDGRLGRRCDPEKLAGARDAAAFFTELLVQDAFESSVRDRLQGSAREIATLVLTAPEYQLA